MTTYAWLLVLVDALRERRRVDLHVRAALLVSLIPSVGGRWAVVEHDTSRGGCTPREAFDAAVDLVVRTGWASSPSLRACVRLPGERRRVAGSC